MLLGEYLQWSTHCKGVNVGANVGRRCSPRNLCRFWSKTLPVPPLLIISRPLTTDLDTAFTSTLPLQTSTLNYHSVFNSISTAVDFNFQRSSANICVTTYSVTQPVMAISSY